MSNFSKLRAQEILSAVPLQSAEGNAQTHLEGGAGWEGTSTLLLSKRNRFLLCSPVVPLLNCLAVLVFLWPGSHVG